MNFLNESLVEAIGSMFCLIERWDFSMPMEKSSSCISKMMLYPLQYLYLRIVDAACCFVVLINAPDLDDLDETPMYSHYLDDQQKYMCVRVLT